MILAADTKCPLLHGIGAEASRVGAIHDDEWPTKGDRQLATCAIRPAGIYGVGEERHFARFLQTLSRGLFVFTIGSPSTLVEFVACENLIHAHMLAMNRLFGDVGCGPLNATTTAVDGAPLSYNAMSVRGRAYFISDCQPMNNWQFFKPLTQGLGYHFPGSTWQQLPYGVMYGLAWCVEMSHRLSVSLFGFNFQPLLVRAEVNKTSVTHYFSCDRAKAELGYRPLIDGHIAMKQLVQHQQRTGRYMNSKKSRSPFRSLLYIVAAVVLFWLFAR
jgi:nucleoside-diphosphate-sugar epimerase